jgi:hypothetical protein
MTKPPDPPDPFAEWLGRQDAELLPPRPGAFDRIARSARRRRWGKALAVTAIALLAVTGGLTTATRLVAGPDRVAVGGPTTTPTPAFSGASVSPAPGPSSPTGSPPSSPSASATTAQTRCHTADLRVTATDDPAGDGAGHLGILLVFTNTSTRTCTMYGYPGVSFVTAENGQQVNDPAQRDSSGGAPTLVTLAPTASAHASLRLAQPGNFGPACQPVNVAGFRVYPPDETAALFASSPQQACSAKGIAVPTLRPVQGG